MALSDSGMDRTYAAINHYLSLYPVQGATGIQGITGVGVGGGGGGATGIQGITGIWGITGQWGITGIWGITGVQGITGIWGVTGLSGGGGDVPTYVAINAGTEISGTNITPLISNGYYRTFSMGTDYTLKAPTAPTLGMRWECWFTASGGDRNLSFDAAILIPSDSGFTSPKTLTSGKLYQILLKYNGSAWMLTSVVGGF